MITGVILAGGQNRRMGGFPKAFLDYRGESLVQRQIRLMLQVCGEIILVTNHPEDYQAYLNRQVRCVCDVMPDMGPLGGMFAGFAAARFTDIWLVGCDMPFVSPEAARWILDIKQSLRVDAVVPFIDGTVHPLHGIYAKSGAAAILPLLSENRRAVNGFLQQVRCERVAQSFFALYGMDSRFVFNVNTPEQYEQSLRMVTLL